MTDTQQDPVVLSWSGGKDSAMTLDALQSGGVEVRALLATVTEGVRRVSMHGVREALLREQARAVGLPLVVAYLPQEASNDIYKDCFSRALAPLQEAGVRDVAFGDIHLSDVREWREAFMEELGMVARFPIWGHKPEDVVNRFIGCGARAWITCVDPDQLAPGFAGRALDWETLGQFPPGADPCGENGEYHSFVWDGPWLAAPVSCRPSQHVRRGGFEFCELEPV